MRNYTKFRLTVGLWLAGGNCPAAGLSGLSLPDARTPLRTQRLSALASLGLARYKSRAPLARRLRASALKTPRLFLLIFVAEQFTPQPNPHVAISELDSNEHSAMPSAANLTEERSVATRCDLRRMRGDHVDYRLVHGRRERQRELVGKALCDRHDAP